jgi:hypothetical protein
MLPGAAPKLSLGASAGTLPLGAWTAVAVGSVVATLALLWRAADETPAGGAPQPLRLAQTEQPAPEDPWVAPSASPAAAEATSTAAPDTGGDEPRGRLQAPERSPAPAGRSPAPAAPDDRSGPVRAPGTRDARSAPVRTATAGAATAQPAQRARPTPAAADPVDPLQEARALKRAHRLLETDPAEALAIVGELSRTLPEEYLSEERHYIEIMALYAVGRRADADRAADHFRSRYPSSAFRERVQAARTGAASVR